VVLNRDVPEHDGISSRKDDIYIEILVELDHVDPLLLEQVENHSKQEVQKEKSRDTVLDRSIILVNFELLLQVVPSLFFRQKLGPWFKHVEIIVTHEVAFFCLADSCH